MIDPKTVAALDGLLDDLAERIAQRLARLTETTRKTEVQQSAAKPVETFEGTLLTKKQAAKFLGMGERTLDRYRKDGQLASIQLSDRMVRFRVEDLEEFVSKHVTRAVEKAAE